MKALGSASVGMAVFLVASSAWAAQWTVPKDFQTIQEAIDSSLVSNGDTIFVRSGKHAGAIVDKSVEIRGQGNAVIDSGPPLRAPDLLYGFLLVEGSSGATINHLAFDVEFPLFSRAPDDITIEHNVLNNPIQGITNYAGDRWQISHNTINDLRTLCGGGIGIIVGDFGGRDVLSNVISHNRISGTLNVALDDCGGYSGTGIVLYADYRNSRSGAQAISDNRIVKNKISLTSNAPNVVDAVAIELTEAEAPDPADHVITDNAIGFNDLRGTATQLAFSPEVLEDLNEVSRNLGDNRGQGSHPKLFLGR